MCALLACSSTYSSTWMIIYVSSNSICAFCMQSKAGPVLIALNPFKDIQIYGKDYVSAYRQKSIDGPHVYAVADAAYNEMIRGECNSPFLSPPLETLLSCSFMIYS